MDTATAEESVPRRASRLQRWNSPWLNPKFIAGSLMIVTVVLMGLLGPLVWDTTLARVASSPLNLPPIWVKNNSIFPPPDPAHPLGTESNGREKHLVCRAAGHTGYPGEEDHPL